MNYKVSVILPIYNGESTLALTLDSLVHQTYKDFELIACIDGTNDGSINILESYRLKFKKLVILKNKYNLGLGSTMNKMVSYSNGKFIAVVEQDDYYYPNRIMLQLNLLEEKKDIGLVSGIAEFWNGSKVVCNFPGLLDNKRQYPTGEEMFLLNYRNQIKVVNSCMMFRKSVHVDNGLYFTQHYPSISVDWTYILRFSLKSKIYGLHKILVRLDRRPKRSSITTFKNKQFLAARELIRSFKYEYPEIVKNEDYNYALRTQLFMELNSKSGYKYFSFLFFNSFSLIFDKRLYQSLKKRLYRKLISN